jgi:hypothetical protein
MTEEEFKRLRIGDLIRYTGDYSRVLDFQEKNGGYLKVFQISRKFVGGGVCVYDLCNITIDVLPVNDIEVQERTPFIDLIENVKTENLEQIIKSDVDLHQDNERALCIACEYGYLEIVKYLVERNADIHVLYDSPLRMAVYRGRLEVVKYLIENGAVIHKRCGFLAVKKGNLDTLKYLAEQGLNVHYNNEHALRAAVYYGHFEIVKYLVEEHNADVNIQNGICNVLLVLSNPWRYISGGTFVRTTGEADRRSLEILEYLIENGCEINPGLINLASREKKYHLIDYLEEVVEQKGISHLMEERLRFC